MRLSLLSRRAALWMRFVSRLFSCKVAKFLPFFFATCFCTLPRRLLTMLTLELGRAVGMEGLDAGHFLWLEMGTLL